MMREVLFFSKFELFRSLIDRFIDFLIAFGRLFESLSIFDQTWDMGVFRGAESNGAIRFFLKIDICGRTDRFDSAELIASSRLFESLSIFDQTSDMGVFGGAESNGAILFSEKIDICGRIDRFDSAELIASGRLFEFFSIFAPTSDIGVFGGAETIGTIRFS